MAEAACSASAAVRVVLVDFRFQRDRWYCATHKVTRCPADEELGLRPREPLSPLTLMRGVFLTILMPFEQARQLRLDFWGMVLGRDARWNATQRAGRTLRMQQDLEAEACHTVQTCPEVTARHAPPIVHLRLAGKRLGLLLNFGATRIKDGIVRLVHGLPD
ncbi:MAG: hypothetical protein HY907_08660 [Deltaproteobacteria bacterium]|nr:hypothetical protein [Deltaproteobacteria bacterium]